MLSMATFRRSTTEGATWFFTAATYRRQPILTHPDVLVALHSAIHEVRIDHPFDIVAWVVLPDHLHAIWRLPAGDAAYPMRWAQIKRKTAQQARRLVQTPLAESMKARGEIGLWQRRYWEHQIRDERDLVRHVDYIHGNPVKHGLAMRVADWPHSTFHRYVAEGLLSVDWSGDNPVDGAYGEA
jgi:putative transposase